MFAKFFRQFHSQISLSLSVTLILAILSVNSITKERGLVKASAGPSGPNPKATLTVPDEVLIGETFRFKVTFSNSTGTIAGYGPFIDLILPAGGTDYNSMNGQCDGIEFVSAQMVGINGGPVPVTAYPRNFPPCNVTGATCAPPITHPYAANGVGQISLPDAAQLVTLELPLGSFQPNQPPVVVEVTAQVSILADADTPLDIYARGGFRFGADSLNNFPVPDPPVFGVPPPPLIPNCTNWDAKASVTPVVFTFRTEDPLSASPGPCFDGKDNGSDGLADADDLDCQRAKTYIGPEDETATGPNFPRQYKIVLNIANLQQITNLNIQDCLPDNAVFVGLVGGQTSPTPVFTPPPSVPLANNCLNFNYPSITGGPTATDIVIVFQFYIPLNDANGKPVLDTATCSNALSPNDVKATGEWTPPDPRDKPMLPQTTVAVMSDTDSVDHQLTDKHLALQKSVQVLNNPTGPVPKDILKYTLDFQVSDYFTMGDLRIEDYLSDGQMLSTTPAPPAFTVTDKYGTSSGSFTLTPAPKPTMIVLPDKKACCKVLTPATGADCKVTGGTILTFNISAAMAQLSSNPTRQHCGILTGGHASSPVSTVPATGQIVFYAEIQDSFTYPHPGDKFVDKHDPMVNCAIINGTIYQNQKQSTCPPITDVSCSDDSRTKVSIVGGILEKHIIAVNGSQTIPSVPQVVANDEITFQIKMNLPSGDTENLEFKDWLPLPVMDATQIPNTTLNYSGTPPPVPLLNTVAFGPGDTSHLLGSPTVVHTQLDNSLTITYPVSLNSPTNTSINIDIRFTLKVSNAPFADGLFLTNEVEECETNTFGDKFCQRAIAPFVLTEPQLQITKGIVWTDNPGGVFTPPMVAPPGITFNGPTGSCPRSNLSTGNPLNSAKLNVTPINSDLSNVDGSDIVAFAIIVRNTGTGLHGAFDVTIKDVLPPSSCGLSRIISIPMPECVTYGDGTPIPYTGSLFTTGIVLTDSLGQGALGPVDTSPGSNGHDIAVITFYARVFKFVGPGCCTNRAQILNYASVDNGPNFVPAGFGGPFTDSAKVCILPTAEKCIRTTSEAHTLSDSDCQGLSQVAIGEIMRYRLKVVLPEGQSLSFQIKDSLPTGLIFLNDGSAKVIFVSNSPITSSAAGSVPKLSGPNLDLIGNPQPACCSTPDPKFVVPPGNINASSLQNPTFNLGTLQNTDNDPNQEFVIVEFNALVQNISANQAGLSLTNKFQVFVAGQPVAQSNTTNAKIVEPKIVAQKSVKPDSPLPGTTAALPGSTATYTITYTNNGTATAFDVIATEALPAGLINISNLSISTSPPGCATPTSTISTGGTTLVVSAPSMPVGCNVKVTFQATVDPNAICGAGITNSVRLNYTSLPGPKGTPDGAPGNATGSSTPGATGQPDGERPYTATAQATLNVACPPCAKPPQGMSAWWPLNETTGSVVHDIINGNDGTPQPGGTLGNPNGPTPVAGYVGGANRFFPNTFHKVPDSSWLNFGSGNLSIDAWVNINILPLNIQPIVDKLSLSSTQKTGYALYIQNKQLKFVLGNGSATTTTYTCTTLINPGAWTHIAVTVNRATGGVGKFYINGTQAGASFAPLTGNITNNVEMWIGKSRLGNSSGEFSIDELEIFQDEVSASDIKTIFKADHTGKCKPAQVACDLVISKTHSPDPLVAGQPAVYTITVKNIGTAPCPGIITVTDALPPPPSSFPGVTFVSGTGAGWSCSISPLLATCTMPGTLSPGATSTIKLTVKVGLPKGSNFNNCVEIKGQGDSNQVNNRACDEAHIAP